MDLLLECKKNSYNPKGNEQIMPFKNDIRIRASRTVLHQKEPYALWDTPGFWVT